MKKLRSEVKSIGIDWDKTKAPRSDKAGVFNGTFAESSTVETLLGTLVLKDGSKYIVGASDVELRFSEYAKRLADLAADQQRVKEILGE